MCITRNTLVIGWKAAGHVVRPRCVRSRAPLSGGTGGGHHYSITINIPTKFRTCERLARSKLPPSPLLSSEGPPRQLLIVMPRNRARRRGRSEEVGSPKMQEDTRAYPCSFKMLKNGDIDSIAHWDTFLSEYIIRTLSLVLSDSSGAGAPACFEQGFIELECEGHR